MTTPVAKQATVQRLRIQNYRVLRDVELQEHGYHPGGLAKAAVATEVRRLVAGGTNAAEG